MKKIIIKDPYFKQVLNVVYDCTLQELMSDLDMQEDYHSELQWQFIWLWYTNYIWLKDINNIWSIAHEVWHYLFDNFKRKGIDPTNSLWEVFCYWIEFYVNTILKKTTKKV